MRVLVIDDNRDVAWCLAQLIKSCGHETAIAVTPADGLSLAQERRPDLIFLDLAMPGEDGYRLALRLRECDLPEVRIIAVSGFQDSAQQRESAGIEQHVLKPISLDTLKRLLEPAAEMADAPGWH
jgi:two-component system CheB/CheR fusion protein